MKPRLAAIARTSLAAIVAALVVVSLSGCDFLFGALLGSRQPAAIITPVIVTEPTSIPDTTLPSPLNIGDVAPDFNLPSPDGNTYSLSDFKGKVVMLELFAPWCPHCQDDAPILNDVYEKYKDRDVQLLAVSASPWGRNLQEERAAQQTPTPIVMDDLIWFRDTFKVPFPILLDKDLTIADQYGVAFYPTIYIIDREGNVASIPFGNYTFENGNPVSLRSIDVDVDVDAISGELDKVLK